MRFRRLLQSRCLIHEECIITRAASRQQGSATEVIHALTSVKTDAVAISCQLIRLLDSYVTAMTPVGQEDLKSHRNFSCTQLLLMCFSQSDKVLYHFFGCSHWLHDAVVSYM